MYYIVQYVWEWVSFDMDESAVYQNVYMVGSLVCVPSVYNLVLLQYVILYRALELAIKHKTHVDTVLAFRHRHLEEIGWKENLPKFQQYSEKVCWYDLLCLQN